MFTVTKPDPDQLKTDKEVLNAAIAAKASLKTLGIIAPPEIQEKIDEIITQYGETARELLDLKNENELEDLDKELEKIVEEQYESALELLKVSGLLKASGEHPSKDKVEKLLKNNISPEQFKVIKQMAKPTLQLVPIERTCEEYVTALNKNKPMPGQKDAYIGESIKKNGVFEKADKRDNPEVGYKIVITEGADVPATLPGDDKNKNMLTRYEWFKNEFQDKGVQGIDLKSYMLLQIAGFAKIPPKPIDDMRGADTMGTIILNINNKRERHSYVQGFWDSQFNTTGFLNSYIYNGMYWNRNNLFRPSVMIDVV